MEDERNVPTKKEEDMKNEKVTIIDIEEGRNTTMSPQEIETTPQCGKLNENKDENI